MHSAADRDKKAPEDGTDLSEYFGVLKDDPLLDKLEADSKRIRELARQNNVPVIENKPLAQVLYKMVKVEEVIPENLYRAVAEVLAYIYGLKEKRVAV